MKSHQQGLSLVELMIAIALGLVLLSGVVQVFLSSKTVYSTQQALSRIQETGRLAIDFLGRDIRMAGYMGCVSRSAALSSVITTTLNNTADFKFDFANIAAGDVNAIRGYTAGAPPAVAPAPTANTDILLVRGASGTGAFVTAATTATQVQVFADASTTEAGVCADASNRISGFCNNDIAVIADCTKAKVFQVTGITGTGLVTHVAAGTPGNLTAVWAISDTKNVYTAGAELLNATTSVYFIGTGTSGRPSLWQNVNGTNLELLEGVENMRVRYGVDTDATADGVPNQYQDAATITAANRWGRVLSVQMELVVASIEDNVVAETQTYFFGGANVTPVPADRRLRQVFSTTVGLRSRVR